jgi:hypothetical protein
LKNKELNPKIPTCSQLEEINETQLTVEQTNKSRLVTKCRFIIEKKLAKSRKTKLWITGKIMKSITCNLIIELHVR